MAFMLPAAIVLSMALCVFVQENIRLRKELARLKGSTLASYKVVLHSGATITLEADESFLDGQMVCFERKGEEVAAIAEESIAFYTTDHTAVVVDDTGVIYGLSKNVQ